MQVSAVNNGAKGKKGKNNMTGDKGKGKDKRKHKSCDSSKNKERDSWNSGQQQVQFRGYCSHCLKWVTRLAQQKNGVVAGIQEQDPRLMVLSPRDGVTSTVMRWNWIRRVDALQP